MDTTKINLTIPSEYLLSKNEYFITFQNPRDGTTIKIPRVSPGRRPSALKAELNTLAEYKQHHTTIETMKQFNIKRATMYNYLRTYKYLQEANR